MRKNKVLGAVGGMLSGNTANLKDEDISAFVWDALQDNLAKGTRPNVWEIKASHADVRFWGGLYNIAKTCAYEIRNTWMREQPSDPPLEFCVLCDEGKVGKGWLDIEVSEVNKPELKHIVALAPYEERVVVTAHDLESSSLEQNPNEYDVEEEEGDEIVQNPPEQVEQEIVDKSWLQETPYAIYCSWDNSTVPVKDDLMVGRMPTNDVVIKNALVSSNHGQLIRDADSPSGWSYVDLKSTNGSTHNGEPFEGRTTLLQGDRIGVANVCFLEFKRL